MAEPVDLLENYNLTGPSTARNGIRRDILRVFTEWSSEPLTANRIFQILKDSGHDIKMDTLYDNLETLIKKSILYKRQLPSKGKRERPSYEYKLRTEAIYELFQLTEDLIDAMGFAQLEAHNNQLFLSKCVASNGKKMKSLRADSKSGYYLDVVHKKATVDDLEMAWRLYRHIQELQNYCDIESPIVKDITVLKLATRTYPIGEPGQDSEKLEKEFLENYGTAGLEKKMNAVVRRHLLSLKP